MHTHTCIYLCTIYTYIYIHMHICVCVCVCIYIYIYTCVSKHEIKQPFKKHLIN